MGGHAELGLEQRRHGGAGDGDAALAVERPVEFKPNRLAQIARQVREVEMHRRDDEFDPARRRRVFEAGLCVVDCQGGDPIVPCGCRGTRGGVWRHG